MEKWSRLKSHVNINTQVMDSSGYVVMGKTATAGTRQRHRSWGINCLVVKAEATGEAIGEALRDGCFGGMEAWKWMALA
ncbi:hypothetical protein G7046_g7284 [Stylonectria norvegica]|nr:hypothetical protein G7046_g7284 [Stylonectria norvegica]